MAPAALAGFGFLWAVVTGLALAVGLLHGWWNGAGIALASAFLVSIRINWMRIAVRVAWSWVAAIRLLMLGWGLRGGPMPWREGITPSARCVCCS